MFRGKRSNDICSGPTYTSHPQTGSFIPAYGEVNDIMDYRWIKEWTDGEAQTLDL